MADQQPCLAREQGFFLWDLDLVAQLVGRVLGPASHCLDSLSVGGRGGHPLEPQTPEKPLLFTSHLDQRRTG